MLVSMSVSVLTSSSMGQPIPLILILIVIGTMHIGRPAQPRIPTTLDIQILGLDNPIQLVWKSRPSRLSPRSRWSGWSWWRWYLDQPDPIVVVVPPDNSHNDAPVHYYTSTWKDSHKTPGLHGECSIHQLPLLMDEERTKKTHRLTEIIILARRTIPRIPTTFRRRNVQHPPGSG
jgi:hypothetical protein